jgi:hypothetical protein
MIDGCMANRANFLSFLLKDESGLAMLQVINSTDEMKSLWAQKIMETALHSKQTAKVEMCG